MLIVKIVLKDINPPLFIDELASLPIQLIGWAGSVDISARLRRPFAESSRVVGVSTQNGQRVEDVAQSGEVRFLFSRDLTSEESTFLDDAIRAHDATQRSQEQQEQDRDQTDITNIIQTEIDAYRANLAGWSSMLATEQLAATRDMFATLGKALRFILRKERGVASDDGHSTCRYDSNDESDV